MKKSEKTEQIIKLSQNENPFGASPLAMKAVRDHYRAIHRYPDYTQEELREKLAHRYGTTKEHVIATNGSVDLMDLLMKTFVLGDENIVTGDVSFVAYSLLAEINNKRCKFAKLTDFTYDIKNLYEACDIKTRVVFIANPNNPTGTIISHEMLSSFMQDVPANILVVIDEAYAEYVNDRTYPDSFALRQKHPNLIIMRTFSKIYGLAGLRVGYAIAQPDIVELLEKSKTPFSVNRIAAAAAMASLEDNEFIKECASINEKERTFLYDELHSLGFNVIPTQGNFIFVDFDNSGEKNRIYAHLVSHCIQVRQLDPFGSETGLRISVGQPDENKLLIRCLKNS